MAAIFGVFILSNGGVSSSIPVAGIMISETGGDVEITHYSGDTLKAGEYEVHLDSAVRLGKKDLSPGTILTYEAPNVNYVAVVYTGKGNNAVIAEKYFGGSGYSDSLHKITIKISEQKSDTDTATVENTGVGEVKCSFVTDAPAPVLKDSVYTNVPAGTQVTLDSNGLHENRCILYYMIDDKYLDVNSFVMPDSDVEITAVFGYPYFRYGSSSGSFDKLVEAINTWKHGTIVDGVLRKDIPLETESLSIKWDCSLTIPENLDMTTGKIKGKEVYPDGAHIWRAVEFKDSLLKVSGSGTTLSIKNEGNSAFTLYGKNMNDNIYGGGINVAKDSEINQESNSGSIIIKNCNAKHGGGIFNYGSIDLKGKLEINGCKVSGNGGGIFNENTGKFDVGELVISNCIASGNGGGVCNKGSIDIKGKLEIKNCKTTSGNGGGICNNKVTFNDKGTFKSKVVSISGDGTDYEAKNGGGIYNNAEIIIEGKLEINDCKVSQSGGGIFNENTGIFEVGELLINNCIASDVNGGGVCNKGSIDIKGILEIKNCKTASGNGGGICNDKGTFKSKVVSISGDENTADYEARNGGGIYNNAEINIEGKLEINDCKVSQSGGGIYNEYTGKFNVGELVINKCTALYNSDTGLGYGGGICNKGTFKQTDANKAVSISGDGTDYDAKIGGGIFNENTGIFEVGELLINNCIASSNGGGVCNKGSIDIKGKLEIKNCKTASGNGGGIYNNKIDGYTNSFTVHTYEITNCSPPSDGIFNDNGATITYIK